MQQNFAVLAQHAEDLPEGSSSQLILVDTEFHSSSPNQPVERIRSPIYAPHRISTQGLLRAMHLFEFCRYVRFACIIWRNHDRLSLESHDLLVIQHGDYIRIALSPPIDAFGKGITARCVASCLRFGVSPGSITEMVDLFGIDDMIESVPNSNRVINASDWISDDLAEDSESFQSDDDLSLIHLSNSSKGCTCSFTDHFLNAVRLYNQANDALPEFPDEEGDILTYAPWVQDVYEAWQGGAVIGPGGVEMLARLETWFTDHTNYQRCYHSRIAVLANDFSNWETQLRHLWRERLVLGAPLEFFMVSPLPEDAAGQIIGQLMIVQRPVRFDRSLVVSIYDSAYDQGRAHSHALVAGDRVDLYSIRLMADVVEDCPPEKPANVCTLWFGARQFEEHERAFARHGHAFRLYIQRAPSATASASSHPEVGSTLCMPTASPACMISSPDWIQQLQRAFDENAIVEREDEGRIIYLQTWQLNGRRAPRCQTPRTVRLRSDITAWQRTLYERWQDFLDGRLPTDFFWVSPQPRNTPGQSYVGHVIIVQQPLPDCASILLTVDLKDEGDFNLRHIAVHQYEFLSAQEAIDAFPVPSQWLWHRIIVRGGQQVWPAIGAPRIDNGENIVIEIDDPPPSETHASEEEHDETVSLQLPPPSSPDILPNRPTNAVDAGHHEHTHTHSLCLDELLPKPVWTVIDCHKIDFVRQQLLFSFLPTPSFDLSQIKCRSSSMKALQETPLWTFELPSRLEFFLDGSFKADSPRATAGVVLIAITELGPRFGGFQSSFSWSTPSAPRAESSATVLALHWALHLVRQLGGHICCAFHFDCTYTGRIAQGLSSSTCNADIAIVERSLALWLETLLYVKPEWTHVKGHSDHPWNDLADSIAFSSRQFQQVTSDLDSLVDSCIFGASDLFPIQWLWLFELSLQGSPEAPLLHGKFWKINSAAPLDHEPQASLHPFLKRVQQSSRHDLSSDFVCLRLATANVLTLFPLQDFASSILGARAESLARQFKDAGIHCIGLQETRCRRQGHDFFEGFHVISGSANSKGHCGVQCWIRQCITVRQESLTIQTEHLRLVYGDDRRLIVKLSHPQLRLIFLVLHAPCNDNAQDIQNWWNRTSQLLPSGLSSWDWVVLCDANSRVGSITSASVGSFGAEVESMRGGLFHEWLIQHNVFLPQTFEAAHQGPHHTWNHAVQGTGRIDYIGVSCNIPLCHVRTWVDDRVDLSIARPDHECVCADLWLAIPRTVKPYVHTPDVAAASDVTWSQDVHTHAALLQQRFESMLPTKPDPMRKKHLTDETVGLIKRKKHAFRHLRRIRQGQRIQELRLVFTQWRHCSAPNARQLEELKRSDLQIAYMLNGPTDCFLSVLALLCGTTMPHFSLTLLRKLAGLPPQDSIAFGTPSVPFCPNGRIADGAVSVAKAQHQNSKLIITVLLKLAPPSPMKVCLPSATCINANMVLSFPCRCPFPNYPVGLILSIVCNASPPIVLLALMGYLPSFSAS